MQIFKIIMQLYIFIFLFLRAKKWENIAKRERIAIALVFIGLIMIAIDQYRTSQAISEMVSHKHTTITLR